MAAVVGCAVAGVCVCVCLPRVLSFPGTPAEFSARPSQRGDVGAEAGEDAKTKEGSKGEGPGIGSGAGGRRALCWLIVLAVLRRSVRLAGLGAVGTVGLRDRGTDAVVAVAICLLPAVVSWFGVSWPGSVVAVLCGGLRAGAVPAGGVAEIGRAHV